MTRGTLILAGATGIAAALLGALPLLRVWREQRLESAPRPLDVVVVTLDTTRADRLGAYGGDPGTTPALDDLARRGVMFERAYAHVPLTLPSHANLMTGLIPSRANVHDNGTFVLDESLPTLAEAFARHGYRTGAFVSSVVLDHRQGLHRGFSRYADLMTDAETMEELAQCRADQTVDRALAWLAEDRARPAFLWVHLYDPHAPYAPPEPFASRFRGRPYDGEVAFMDAQIGRLIAAVTSRTRPTLVAALADHGEALGEHQEPSHGFFVYEATQHIPLILSLPGYLPHGLRVDPIVRTVDVMPTLLEIAGLPPPQGIDGRSLVPLMMGRSRASPGPVYLESYTPRFWWGAREVLGVRTGPWLFVDAPRPELYDLEQDPAESVNLVSERPAEVERLGALVRRLAPSGDVFASRKLVDEETARRLGALGYLGGVGQQAAPPTADLPDAKDYAPLLKQANRAQLLAARHQYHEALEAYQEILTAAPRVVAVRGWVAKMLLALKRYDEAFEGYRELRDEYPGEEGYHIGMARARLRQGRKAEALALVKESLKAFPQSIGLHENAGIILQDQGRLADAEAAFAEATRLGPRELRPRLALAALCDKQAKLEEAVRHYVAVVDLSPNSSEGRIAAQRLGTLGEALARKGMLSAAREAYERAIRYADVDADVYLNMGLVCYRLGLLQEAIAVVTQGAARHPESIDLAYRSGRLLAEAGARAEAEAAYRRALELAPARHDARFNLARLLESWARPAEAAILYRQVLEAAPGSKEAVGAREALRHLLPQAAER